MNKYHMEDKNLYMKLAISFLAIVAVVVGIASYKKNSTRIAHISYVNSANKVVEIDVPESSIYYHNGYVSVFMPNNEQLLIYGNFTVKTSNK